MPVLNCVSTTPPHDRINLSSHSISSMREFHAPPVMRPTDLFSNWPLMALMKINSDSLLLTTLCMSSAQIQWDVYTCCLHMCVFYDSKWFYTHGPMASKVTFAPHRTTHAIQQHRMNETQWGKACYSRGSLPRLGYH